jgi:uncharacterized membrane protein YfcA
LSFLDVIFLLGLAFVTATVSGIFGMAGGLLLMGGLAGLLTVNAAFVAHGILQLASNGWRAILHRRFLSWRIVGYFALAGLAAAIVAALLHFRPTKPYLYILLGLTPLFVWLPMQWSKLDANKPVHALLGGFVVTSLNLLAGVAGPLLDVFFVRTDLTRKEIVATKAATQVFSHLMKIAVYGAPLLALSTGGLPPLWVLAICVGLSFAGAVLGGKILERMTDLNFKRYTRWIVTALGIFYFAQGVTLLLQPSA